MVAIGAAARQAERASRPHCAGPSGFLAVLAFRGISLELAALRQERALIRERLRSSAAQKGRLTRSAYRAMLGGATGALAGQECTTAVPVLLPLPSGERAGVRAAASKKPQLHYRPSRLPSNLNLHIAVAPSSCSNKPACKSGDQRRTPMQHSRKPAGRIADKAAGVATCSFRKLKCCACASRAPADQHADGTGFAHAADAATVARRTDGRFGRGFGAQHDDLGHVGSSAVCGGCYRSMRG